MSVDAAETSSSSFHSTLLSMTCAPKRASPITAPAAMPGRAPPTIPVDSTPASGHAEPEGLAVVGVPDRAVGQGERGPDGHLGHDVDRPQPVTRVPPQPDAVDRR